MAKEWKADDPQAPWHRVWRGWRHKFGRPVEDEALAPRWWMWVWCLILIGWIIAAFFLFLWIERAIA